MDKTEFISILFDTPTSRDKQVAVGPSEIGGCRRKTWYKLGGAEKTNLDTLQLPAGMGTAIHKWIESKIVLHDPFEERYILEKEVEYDGLMGHVDCYDKTHKQIIDWKTITKGKAASFPSEQQRMQVQIYGYLMASNGYEVDTVSLVGIPRDGNESHVKWHVESYDANIAREGLLWLQGVREAVAIPDPERKARICQYICSYYDPTGLVGCAGLR